MKSQSESTSVATALVKGHVKAESVTEFKMGGFENLDEDGIEIVDKTYPKYAEVNTMRKGDIQVCSKYSGSGS